MAGFRGRSVEHRGERPQYQHRDELEPQLLDRETEGPGLLGEPQEIHRHRPKEPREHSEAETLRDLLARGGSDPSAVQGHEGERHREMGQREKDDHPCRSRRSFRSNLHRSQQGPIKGPIVRAEDEAVDHDREHLGDDEDNDDRSNEPLGAHEGLGGGWHKTTGRESHALPAPQIPSAAWPLGLYFFTAITAAYAST